MNFQIENHLIILSNDTWRQNNVKISLFWLRKHFVISDI